MEILEVTTPEEFISEGFTIPALATCLSSSVYKHYFDKLQGMIHSDSSLNKRPPFYYQQVVAPLFAAKPSGLAAYSMGVGKSYIACLAIKLVYGHCLNTLRSGVIHVITKKHLVKLTWAKELDLAGFAGLYQVIKSEKDFRNATAPILLYHYDLLNTQTKKGRLASKAGYKTEYLWKVIPHICQPAMMVLDEVHCCREGTDRTKAVQHLRRKAKRCIGLTGTPMDSLVSHLATVFSVIYGENSSAFPFTKSSFTKKFTHYATSSLSYATGEAQAATKKVPTVVPNLIPSFYKSTRHLMHRMTYSDKLVAHSSGLKFPDIDSKLIVVPMHDNHRALYDQTWRSSEAELKEILESLTSSKVNLAVARAKALGRVNLLRQVSSTPWLLDPTIQTTGKLEKLVEIARSKWVLEGRKGIIFTSQIGTGKMIVQALANAGLKAVRVYATDDSDNPKSLKQDERNDRIERFQESEDIADLVINQQLGSEGLNLIEASWVLYYDHPWSSNAVDQGNARCKRPGQVYPVIDVYHLAHESSVDYYTLKLLERKSTNNSVYVDFNFSTALWSADQPADVNTNIDIFDLVGELAGS